MGLVSELRRRNVLRMAVLYAVAAWLIMQVAEVIIGLANLPEWIGPTILGLLAVGFPIAVVLSWFYELTPEGISLEKDIDAAESITRVTGRRLDIIVISMLCAAVILFAYDKWWIPAPSQQSVAVLPFVNMSADADNEYFSDGISEELLNALVKVSTLHVASRTSAFAYKGKDLPLSQIARELNVENILEGSVRKAGNRVRITAQLINAKSDRHIWSEIYERELVDIFDIQKEISNNIVDALKVALNVGDAAALERAQRPTENAEAYELYLQGRYAWHLRHEDNIRRSIDLFEQAIALDPNFARAYEALASSWAVISAWSAVPRREALPHFRSNSEKALRLDPSLAEARSTLAEALTLAGDWAGALAQFRHAIESEPRNPIPHKMFAETLNGMGYSKSALEEMLLAYGLDPASPVINEIIVTMALAQNKDELYLKHKLISQGLGSGLGTDWDLYDSYVREEDWPEFDFKSNKAAEILRNKVIENQDWFKISGSWISHGHYQAIRQTAEFKALLSELGLVDHYRQHGWPDLCRPLGEEDFECD
jgi:TolB-like protein